MNRARLLALLFVGLGLCSCTSELTTSEAVYDDFLTNYLTPEKWDEEVAKRREHAGDEYYLQLRRVMVFISEERDLYARRCDFLTDPASPACNSIKEMSDVLTALSDVELGLKEGRRMSDGLGAFLNYNLSDAHLAERERVAKRMKPFFEKAAASEPAAGAE